MRTAVPTTTGIISINQSINLFVDKKLKINIALKPNGRSTR